MNIKSLYHLKKKFNKYVNIDINLVKNMIKKYQI